jgi:hypothetical protein
MMIGMKKFLQWIIFTKIIKLVNNLKNLHKFFHQLHKMSYINTQFISYVIMTKRKSKSK